MNGREDHQTLTQITLCATFSEMRFKNILCQNPASLSKLATHPVTINGLCGFYHLCYFASFQNLWDEVAMTNIF